MTTAVVLAPAFAGLADDAAFAGAASVRVRTEGAGGAERGEALRAQLAGGTDVVLLVDRALPVRPDWAREGAPLALVADHLNLTGDNPLVGANADDWGPRFPDMTDAWDPALRAAARTAAVGAGIELREGVVAGVASGARTAAEVTMLRLLGADMASEGFVHEAIVARHAGRRVVGLALLAPDAGLPGDASHLVRAADVVLAAAEAV